MTSLFSPQPDKSTAEGTLRMTTLERDLFSSPTKLYDCFPGGNDTFMVLNSSFQREHYARINQLILERFNKFEQGAILEKPSNGGVIRMQMAGGEFCGNATRSAAALVATTYRNNRDLEPIADYSAIQDDGETLSFSLEVSGTDSSISARAAQTGDGWDVEIELPRMAQRNVKCDVPLTLANNTVPCTVVTLEGISHVLIPDSSMPFINNPEIFKLLVADVIEQLGWRDLSAFGLIWVRSDGGHYAIEPVVYVSSIQTCIYESACGSGTMAVALAFTGSEQTSSTSVRQPSGAVLEATIDQSDSAKGIVAKLRGPVEIRGDLNACLTQKAANE